MNMLTFILLIIAIAAIVLAVVLLVQRNRSRRLRRKFGVEYDRMAAERGIPRAENELRDREKRVQKYHIRPLTQDERSRFASAWRVAQEHFVEDPRMAVSEADDLVTRVMTARGYPMRDFDRTAEDLSVDHGTVVQNYRAAHNIAVRDRQSPVDTEDLRRAMVHYRTLYESLIGERVNEPVAVRA